MGKEFDVLSCSGGEETEYHARFEPFTLGRSKDIVDFLGLSVKQ